jgi:hypothetical protein
LELPTIVIMHLFKIIIVTYFLRFELIDLAGVKGENILAQFLSGGDILFHLMPLLSLSDEFTLVCVFQKDISLFLY